MTKCWIVSYGLTGNGQDEVERHVFLNEDLATKSYEDWVNQRCAEVGLTDEDIEAAWDDQNDPDFFQDSEGEFWARIEQGKFFEQD